MKQTSLQDLLHQFHSAKSEFQSSVAHILPFYIAERGPLVLPFPPPQRGSANAISRDYTQIGQAFTDLASSNMK
jgi:hypothetical protein